MSGQYTTADFHSSPDDYWAERKQQQADTRRDVLKRELARWAIAYDQARTHINRLQKLLDAEDDWGETEQEFLGN